MKLFPKYKVLWLVVLVTTFASCKKSFLELAPPTSVSPEEALLTEADVLVAVRGMYSGLRTGVTIGATSYAFDAFGRTIPLIGDLLADNTYQSSRNGNRYTNYNGYSYVASDGNALGLWASLYTVILRANNIINSTLPASANMDQYKGEAYAVRALSYFTLVRYYARPYTDDPNKPGLPIVKEYAPDYKPARSTISDVYALINSDLDKAFGMITKYVNSSQMSKYAVKALQAKVFLTMGDMEKAKAAALEVINKGGFKLVGAAEYVAYWNDPGYRTDKVETLFEVSSDAITNLGFDQLSYMYSQAGNYGDFLVSDSLIKLFNTNDVRKGLYPNVTRSNISVVAVNKYPSINGDRSDTKVLRLSEMYLIAAEAFAGTDETEARNYANFITGRRGADPIASTGKDLYEEIITERRKELAFEGDRYLDLQRLKRDVTRSRNYPAAVDTVIYSDYRRVLPIPQAELDANPQIKAQQNTGYQ